MFESAHVSSIKSEKNECGFEKIRNFEILEKKVYEGIEQKISKLIKLGYLPENFNQDSVHSTFERLRNDITQEMWYNL